MVSSMVTRLQVTCVVVRRVVDECETIRASFAGYQALG